MHCNPYRNFNDIFQGHRINITEICMGSQNPPEQSIQALRTVSLRQTCEDKHPTVTILLLFLLLLFSLIKEW